VRTTSSVIITMAKMIGNRRERREIIRSGLYRNHRLVVSG
jgi:hypothetical protein